MKATLFLEFNDNTIEPYKFNKEYNFKETDLYIVKKDGKYKIGKLYKTEKYNDLLPEVYSPIKLSISDCLLNTDIIFYEQKNFIINDREYYGHKKIIKDKIKVSSELELAEIVFNYDIHPRHLYFEGYKDGWVYGVDFIDFGNPHLYIDELFHRQTIWLSFDLSFKNNKNLKPYIVPDLYYSSMTGEICGEHQLMPVMENGKIKIGRVVKNTEFDRKHPSTLNRIPLPYSLYKLKIYVNKNKPIVVNSGIEFIETLASIYNKDKNANIVIKDKYNAKYKICMNKDNENVSVFYKVADERLEI